MAADGDRKVEIEEKFYRAPLFLCHFGWRSEAHKFRRISNCIDLISTSYLLKVSQTMAALLPIFLITAFAFGSTVVTAFGLHIHPLSHCHYQPRISYGHPSLHFEKINQRYATPRLHLFGFGNNDVAEKELARFTHPLASDANPDVKFDSLSMFVSDWSKLFTDKEQKMGLTTPVEVVELKPQANVSGVQLIFKKGRTGGRSAYQDKDDEKYKRDETDERKEEKAVAEGGVEVRVEKLQSGDLEVVASRCQIEEGTLVKEMSEQVIIDSLRKAMAAWKNEQGLHYDFQ